MTVAPGTVGYLSDYFDQKAQASLADEAQAGKSHAAAPNAPIAPTAPTAPTVPIALTASGTYSVPYTQFSIANLTTAYLTSINATFSSATKTYTFNSDIQITGGNLTLRLGTSANGLLPRRHHLQLHGSCPCKARRTLTVTSTGNGSDQDQHGILLRRRRTLAITNTGTTAALTVADSFGQLHVAGALTVTGNVAITASSLYADSTTATTAISNTTATAVTHNLGQVYARGPLSVSGRVSLTTTSLYAASTTTISNTTTTAVTDNLGQVYAAGAMSVTDRVSLTTTSLLANSSVTINNTTATPTSASLGNVRTAGAFSVSGPVTLTTTALYSNSSATIGNTGAAVTDNLGAIYAVGNVGVSGNVTISAPSYLYGGGNVTITGPSSGSTADSFGAIYAVGDVSVSGNVTVSAPSYLYGGGDVTFTGPSTGTTTHEFGLIYTSGTTKTLTFLNNVQIHATSVVANGDFTISGATIPVQDWLGAVFVAAFSSSSNPSSNHGDVNWSGTASVTSRNYVAYNAAPASEAAKPQPMWLGRYFQPGRDLRRRVRQHLGARATPAPVSSSTRTGRRSPPCSARCSAPRRGRRRRATWTSGRARSRWSTSSCATTTASTRRWSTGRAPAPSSASW